MCVDYGGHDIKRWRVIMADEGFARAGGAAVRPPFPYARDMHRERCRSPRKGTVVCVRSGRPIEWLCVERGSVCGDPPGTCAVAVLDPDHPVPIWPRDRDGPRRLPRDPVRSGEAFEGPGFIQQVSLMNTWVCVNIFGKGGLFGWAVRLSS